MKKLLILAVTIAVLFGVVAAQTETYNLVINDIDASAFPEVAVSFRALDADGQFAGGLTDFTLAENGQPVESFDVRLNDEQAVSLVFVLDLGRYSGTTTISDSLLRQSLRQWVDGGYFRDGVDTASIVVSGGAGYQEPITIVLEPTQSAADFRAAVDALDLSPGQPAQSLAAVQDVLTRIADLGLEPSAPVYVVYASRIVDTIVNSEAVALAQTLGEQARELDVPVYALHTDLDGGYDEPFRALASASGGQLVAYNRRQDTNQVLNTLYGQLAASGRSYVVTYRSASGDTAERTVTLGMPEHAAQPASSNYQVNVSAPTVSITSPETAFTLLRTASDETAASDTPVFDLTQTTIRLDVTWTDGFSRRISQAELWVNGELAGTFSNPTPVTAEPPADAAPESSTPAVETAEAVTAVTQTYEITWDLSALITEGGFAQALEVRVTDELGIQAASAVVEGNVTVELPDVLPTVTVVSPSNNATVERAAVLDSAGAISGYSIDEIPLVARLVWPGEEAGEIVSAEIAVDGTVVANFPYPTIVPLEQDTRSFSNEPVQAQATMELAWDIRDMLAVGPNLHDVVIQVRNSQGAIAASAPATLNVQVYVPSLQLPTVTIIAPEANANIPRVAVPRAAAPPEFQDSGSYTVIAGINWPDNTPRTLVVAELLVNGLPLGTESYPTLLSPEEVGRQASGANPQMRFFRVNWDISGLRSAGANLGQLQVRVRDADGFEAVSAPVTVNVQVDIINPPTVTILAPVNNMTITRAGQISSGSATPTFEVNTVSVQAVVEWPPQLSFILTGGDLVANGAVVGSLPPMALDAANQALVELPDGSRRLALEIPWDVSAITAAGANLYQLQIRVRGESDLMAISAPVNLNVQVDVPDALPPLVNITSPSNESTVQLSGGHVPVVAEVLWPDNQARGLHFVELSVDGLVQQTLLYPQGTRFELAWDASDLPPGTSSHQIAVRVRDILGIEAVSPAVAYSVDVPEAVAPVLVEPGSSAIPSEGVPAASAAAIVAPGCPANLLEGWNDVNCLRERAVLYLPWLAVLAMGALLFVRTRRTYVGGITRTLVGVGRKRHPLANLYVVQGPPARVGQTINLYANITSIGRDARLADIQLYEMGDESSISTQHCTIRHVRGRFSIVDDNSTNGTQVNGRYIDEPVLLNDGDEITLGVPDRMGVVLRFHTKVVDMKEQEAKAEKPARPTNGSSHPAPVVPVRSQSANRPKSVDMMDNILTEIAEKQEKSFKPDLPSTEEDNP
jgi:hypothetical protein